MRWGLNRCTLMVLELIPYKPEKYNALKLIII